MSDWKSQQLNKWLLQLDKPLSLSRAWYWRRLRFKLDALVRQAVLARKYHGVVLDSGGGMAPMFRYWMVEHLPQPEKLPHDFFEWLKPRGELVSNTLTSMELV